MPACPLLGPGWPGGIASFTLRNSGAADRVNGPSGHPLFRQMPDLAKVIEDADAANKAELYRRLGLTPAYDPGE